MKYDIWKKKNVVGQNRFIQDIHRLPGEIKNNTIILIGQMGTGKSTVAKLLSSNGNRISLDDRKFLEVIYARRKRFSNFKNFEFGLTGTVLSTLKRPSVIDFGAGHSIYKDNR